MPGFMALPVPHEVRTNLCKGLLRGARKNSCLSHELGVSHDVILVREAVEIIVSTAPACGCQRHGNRRPGIKVEDLDDAPTQLKEKTQVPCCVSCRILRYPLPLVFYRFGKKKQVFTVFGIQRQKIHVPKPSMILSGFESLDFLCTELTRWMVLVLIVSSSNVIT